MAAPTDDPSRESLPVPPQAFLCGPSPRTPSPEGALCGRSQATPSQASPSQATPSAEGEGAGWREFVGLAATAGALGLALLV